MTEDDILVVAPFNAHVARLRAALPGGIRVGTVDKFQGQQAPVVVYSMASSSAADAPRGTTSSSTCTASTSPSRGPRR